MGSKKEMLLRVSAALGREAQQPVPIPRPLETFSCGTTKGTEASLVAQFCAEAEKVGAQVSRVQSSDEIKSYLAEILSDDKPASVALSNSKAVHDSGIREWLISQDIQVLPSINEFGSIEANAATRQSADSPTGESAIATNSATATNKSETSKGNGKSLTSSHQRALMGASLGVTSADYAIADTGTLVLVSGNEQHRLISLLPPTHLCLLDSSRVVANLSSLLACVSGEYQFSKTPPLAMTFITGPSRTADIELTLTVGVHGPRQQHILIHSTKEEGGLPWNAQHAAVERSFED